MLFGVPIERIFIGILPTLLIMGGFFVFLRKMTGPNSHQARAQALMTRQIEVLERIALALEKRS